MAKNWRNGKPYTTRTGKNGIYLNPSQKGGKFAEELHKKYKLTNSGAEKVDKNGELIALTKTEAAYRSGYLAAQKDSSKLFNFMKKFKKTRKKKTEV